MRKNRHFLILLSFFFLALLVFPYKNNVHAQEIGEVKIGTKVIFRFLKDGRIDPEQKAKEIQETISKLYKENLTPDDVRMEKINGIFYIFWGPEIITHIEPDQAALNKTTPGDLANKWTQNLRNALNEQSFYFSPPYVEMPLNSYVTVKADGPAKGRISREYDEGSVNTSIDQERGEITIYSTSSGMTNLLFYRGGKRARLVVKVRDAKNDIPARLSVNVSGDPVPREILEQAARNTVINYLKRNGYRGYKVGRQIRTSELLRQGISTTAIVPVTITDDEGKPLKTDVMVTIKNIGMKFSDIKQLMVSDRPERITRDGILFKSGLFKEKPARLLFYHKNATNKVCYVWVELQNRSNKPVDVLLCGKSGGPARWGANVGHDAALKFLEAYQNNVSYNVNIPPNESLVISEFRVAPSLIVAGYKHMEITGGDKVEVFVKTAFHEPNPRAELPVLHQPFNPFRITPKGVFEPANLYSEVEYTIGQEEKAECVIGKAPWLIDPVTGEPNNGNYGAFYYFNIKLNNPTDQKKRVGFFLVPHSVLVRGSFLLGGKIMETAIVRNPREAIFAYQDLQPGETKELSLITTPEGGSHYPAGVVIKEIEQTYDINVIKRTVRPEQEVPEEEEEEEEF